MHISFWWLLELWCPSSPSFVCLFPLFHLGVGSSSSSFHVSHFFSRGQNLQFQLPLEDSAGEVKTLNKLFGDGGGKFTCDFNETGKQCFLQIWRG